MEKSLPIEIFISKNFKIVLESSQKACEEAHTWLNIRNMYWLQPMPSLIDMSLSIIKSKSFSF